MDKIDELLRLNVEIEGLLHVYKSRKEGDEEHIDLIRDKYTDFCRGMDAFLASRTATDYVKDFEAESAEVEDETDAAANAIERGEDMQPAVEETIEEVASENVIEESDDIVPVTLGDIPREEPLAEVKSEVEATEQPLEQEPYDTKDETEPAEHQGTSEIRVDEMLARRAAVDFKRLFTLNDKIGFQRDLFGNSKEAFDETLEHLSALPTYADAKAYLLETRNWDEKNIIVEDFLEKIKPHYQA